MFRPNKPNRQCSLRFKRKCIFIQGMGTDTPILQWVPLIKKIQSAGKSLMVDLQVEELEDFIKAMDPKGLMLCIPADEAIQPDIIKRIEKW